MRRFDVWALYGLKESPFFQETLAPGSHYPTALFVGREGETEAILRGIGGSLASRQVIHGDPGVGKTTLAQHIKDVVATEGYLVRWKPVSLMAGEDAGVLVIDVLASVHEAVLAGLPEAAKAEPMEDARGLVRAFRLSEVSGGVSVMGSGVQAQRQTQYVRPVLAGVLSEAWRLLLDIIELARRERGTRGVIVQLNNLENLMSVEDVEHAALAFRDVRDLFLAPGIHWLVVGTSEAAYGVLGRFPQVRSIFLPSLPALGSLAEDEFLDLLRARYQYLSLPDTEPVLPVEDDAARRIYDLFRGDLRGALHTLDQGCLALAGLTEGDPVRPLRFEEITASLRPLYAEEMIRETSPVMVERMREIGEFARKGVTQAHLERAWGVSRARVSQVLQSLEAKRYVRPLSTQGRSRLYGLTGTGMIALGLYT